MNCIHCKKTIPEASEFCPYCGGKVMVVPESWKCPQCNLDVPEGTKTCPNCGSPISAPLSADTHQLKFCRKCGTQQKDGQKFCPKCGEPFFDENGKPYLKGIRKELQDAKDKMLSKADELTQQGNNLFEEKIQPRLDEQIESLKSVDWEEKKVQSLNSMHGFLSDVDKLRKATIWVAILAVLWFFLFNNGFSASWTWWVFAVVFIAAAFYKIEEQDKKVELKKTRWSFAFAIFLGLVLVFNEPSSSSSLGSFDSEVNVDADNDQDMETLAKMGKIRDEIKSILPQVESLYNAHQLHMAQGRQYASSPAWGRWQDLNNRIDNLWDEYIRLARKLSGNNDDVIEEAKQSKRTMDKSFKEMFGPHY